MKRDMDLIRRIAIEVEAMPPRQALTGLEEVDPFEFAFHAQLMLEAGLISGEIHEYISDDPPAVFVRRLTWEGCAFVDSVRDQTLWNKAKSTVLAPAASFTFGLLKDWVREEIKQGFPTLKQAMS